MNQTGNTGYSRIVHSVARIGLAIRRFLRLIPGCPNSKLQRPGNRSQSMKRMLRSMPKDTLRRAPLTTSTDRCC